MTLGLLSEKIDHPDIIESAYEDILNKAENEHTLSSSKKPVHAVLDILKSSARNSDFETTKYGLYLLQKKTESIIDNKQLDDFKKRIYLSDLFEDIGYIGITAAKGGSEEVTKLICNLLGENGVYSINSHTNILTLSLLEKIGVLAAKNNLEEAVETVLDFFNYYVQMYDEYELEPNNGILDLEALSFSYVHIGNESADRRMEDVCLKISFAFLDIEKLLLKKDNAKASTHRIDPFYRYGDSLVNNKLDSAASAFIKNLGSITIIALMDGNTDVVSETIGTINELARKCSVDSNMFYSTISSSKVLEEIGILMIDHYIEDYYFLLPTIIKSIQISEINIRNQEQMDTLLDSNFSIKTLEKIGSKSILNGLNKEAFYSISALSNIGINILDFDLTWFARSKINQILNSMCSISEISINNENYKITRDIAFRIYEIGVKASTSRNFGVTHEAERCLDEIYSFLVNASTKFNSEDYGELDYNKNKKLKREILEQIETLKKSVEHSKT
ncbi:hypothetical protein J2755_000552 [Methanohalophilus levihalophilus]|uniref:hypothetical protein n=1 Tax=Methanohalophilus levihalophilus TaxID=1431282 RepID=UPI001AE6E288|nr:hypothetical protein [Methanohalophilus levihalophilus]MBP2029632.1 hypothetical protein [Methanohalophilus levihalophilus]